MKLAPRSFTASLLLPMLLACTASPGGFVGEGEGEGESDAGFVGGNCDDEDPLTNEGWAGFCADRVDDNCQADVPTDPCDTSNPQQHHYCATGDEPCPATQPASAAPAFDCAGAPPDNVRAYAAFDNGACAYVYESLAFPGEHYVAVKGFPLVNCTYDNSARRHLYFSNLDEGECPEIKYVHEYSWSQTGGLYPTDLQKLSNHCRKMIRNTSFDDPGFEPDIQYFAASQQEADAKLDVLETAEFACIGIDNEQGQPYRAGEVWTLFSSTPIVRVP